MAQVGKIDGYRFGPAEQDAAPRKELRYCEQCKRHSDGADRIDVAQGIQAHAALGIRGQIAEVLCDVTMRRLVQRDREDDGQRINGDRLNEVQLHADVRVVIAWYGGRAGEKSARSGY